MTFAQKLAAAVEAHDSLVCVGLDPVPARMPDGIPATAAGVAEFNRRLVEATADVACCFKPNFAFYGALGRAGWDALATTLEAIPNSVPVLLDAKVGDIGSTAQRWAHMIFAELGVDAVTVNPYMGGDAVEPFTAYADRGVFLVCLTSNPGSADVEYLESGGAPVYEHVARKALEWGAANGNCGLVVGATRSASMAGLRALAPDLPFLVPGVGAQGGDLEGAVRGGLRADGAGVLVNSSRGIMHASDGADFAAAARAAAIDLRDQINAARSAAG